MNMLKKINRLKRGQAIIEYTLMLVISVILVTGFSMQFYKPLEEFIDGLFGQDGSDGYYTCLFAVASLPGMPVNCTSPDLGAGDSSWANNTGSGSGGSGGSHFPGGTFPGGGSGGDSNTFPSGSLNPPPYGSYNPPSPTIQDWGNSNSSYTGGSPNNSGGSKSFLANNSRNGRGLFDSSNSSDSDRSGKSNKIGSFNKDKELKSELTPISNDGFGSGGFFKRKGSYIISAGNLTEEQEETQNRQAPITASSVEEKSSQNEKNKKARFIINKKSKTQEIKDDKPITFGKFIKYIIMAIIILTILFFIGSRALEMSENLKAS